MKKILLVFLMIVAVLVTGCSVSEVPKTDGDARVVIKINAKEAKTRLDSEEGIILVDVRTPEEFREGHIPDAILIPVDEIAAKAETVIPDKEANYFIYCRSGNRSATAASQLVDMGYQKIYDLGGINDWPYEKETGDEQ